MPPQDTTTGQFVTAEHPIVRFSRFVNATESCWFWLGGRDKDGYGVFWLAGRTMRAHRFSYEVYRHAIPAGLDPDHLCKNPSCVNPLHLEVVTPQENWRRGNSPHSLNSRKTHCKRGHLLSGNNLYITPDKRRQCRDCRRKSSQQRQGGVQLASS